MLNLALCVRERSDTPRFGVKGLGANLSILKACLELVAAHIVRNVNL